MEKGCSMMIPGRSLKKLLYSIFIAIILGIWVGPFVWMIMSSFKPKEVIIANELILLFTPSWEHYRLIFSKYNYWVYARNSFVVAILTTFLTVSAATLTAYSISRYRTGGRLLELWIMFTRMLPPAVLLIPLFLILRTAGLINTVTGLIIADTTFILSFSIWILRGFFDEVPIELEEAATCDGATRLQNLFYIVFPIAKPGITATVIFSLIFAWNEYLFAMVFAAAPKSKTLPAAANDFITGYAINWGPVFASGCLIALPVFVVSILLQRYIVRGLTLGAFK